MKIKIFTTNPELKNDNKYIFATKKQYECNVANRGIVAEVNVKGYLYWITKGQLKTGQSLEDVKLILNSEI